MMSKYWVVSLVIVSLLLLGACGQISTKEGVTEQNQCSGDDVPAIALPQGPTWTWLDITIGESTEQDVVNRFGVPDLTRLWPREQPQACIYVYKETTNTFRVWLAGNTVIGLESGRTYGDAAFHMKGAPLTFEQAKELYGRAELIGYSNLEYGMRSVAWINQGVQAEVSIYIEGMPISTIRYFTPMTEEQFSDSLWSQLILDENPTQGPPYELIDIGPKDPFDWD